VAMAYGSRPIYTDEEVRRVGGYHEPIAEEELPIPPDGGLEDDPPEADPPPGPAE